MQGVGTFLRRILVRQIFGTGKFDKGIVRAHISLHFFLKRLIFIKIAHICNKLDFELLRID